jgi:hypothetical protein
MSGVSAPHLFFFTQASCGTYDTSAAVAATACFFTATLGCQSTHMWTVQQPSHDTRGHKSHTLARVRASTARNNHDPDNMVVPNWWRQAEQAATGNTRGGTLAPPHTRTRHTVDTPHPQRSGGRHSSAQQRTAAHSSAQQRTAAHSSAQQRTAAHSAAPGASCLKVHWRASHGHQGLVAGSLATSVLHVASAMSGAGACGCACSGAGARAPRQAQQSCQAHPARPSCRMRGAGSAVKAHGWAVHGRAAAARDRRTLHAPLSTL